MFVIFDKVRTFMDENKNIQILQLYPVDRNAKKVQFFLEKWDGVILTPKVSMSCPGGQANQG